MTDQSNNWPDCIGEHAAGLAQPRNWAAACAATQARLGCDIGTHGRALLADMRGEVSPLIAECGAECQTIHNEMETSGGDGNASASLFDNCGTINTEGDLGLSGE
ncbi:hypothetical protein [Gluconobacter albidus]|uniref:Uncharacterized protein n=1 Tax=Gluconobacter albidus TaxID=318683 RepID=A0ABQ5X2U0_9PROT|nr:hypothetical protein [Gluconobacter albidus]GBQ90075.1 hypothetical protein AA3250_1965 [Gluconobacter albidus NBRC 3250]GLQ69166.1 hypothetical protein GCM10007866_16170 [Gluconobacter albidus]